MPIGLTSRIKRVEKSYGSSFGKDLIIFDSEKGNYFGSGFVGERVWSLIKNNTSVKEICEKLTEQFDVDQMTCEREVIEFLDELLRKNLIEIA